MKTAGELKAKIGPPKFNVGDVVEWDVVSRPSKITPSLFGKITSIMAEIELECWEYYIANDDFDFYDGRQIPEFELRLRPAIERLAELSDG